MGLFSFFHLSFHSPDLKIKAEKVQFITDFYRGYLDTTGEAHSKFEKEEPFFSKSARQALEHNKKVCAEKSRGDDICGYGADGDIFLNTQETGSNLNFHNSKFNAKPVGPDKVEASFNVYPDVEGTFYDRKIIFKMVKEDSHWRVSDLTSHTTDSKGRSKMESMIDQINEENASYEKEAKDLSITWIWIRTYLDEKDFFDRALRFTSPQLTICSDSGSCKTVDKKNSEVLEAFKKLNAYYVGPGGIGHRLHPWPGSPDFGKKESIASKVGASAAAGPFKFTFKDGAWWMEKINFSKIK